MGNEAALGQYRALTMALPPSPDSGTSLVSIDPAIARQISRSKSSHDPLNSPAKPSLSTSAPEQQKHRQIHTTRNEQSQEKPLPKGLENARKNSLRRVKNSNEVLRQRSTRVQQETKSSGLTSTSTEGRHFTVGNVGTGGKLYLRYAILQRAPDRSSLSFL
jgi:hypothetical protein